MKQSRLAPTIALWLFPVVTVALLAAVVFVIVVLEGENVGSGGTRLLLQWVALPLAVAIGYGAWAAYKHRPEPAEGVDVTRDQHPDLWAEVDRLAASAQTEPPARIVIVPEVNAAVTEVAGSREMLIGLPLLATFTVGQLRAVLAHELGHYAGGDTAAAARTMRRRVLLQQMRERVGVLWRWFFTAYARRRASRRPTVGSGGGDGDCRRGVPGSAAR